MENNKEYLQQIKELKYFIKEFVSRKEIITLKEDVKKETNIFALNLTRIIIKENGNKAMKELATIEDNPHLQKEWIKLSKLIKEQIKEAMTVIDERIKELENEKI